MRGAFIYLFVYCPSAPASPSTSHQQHCMVCVIGQLVRMSLYVRIQIVFEILPDLDENPIDIVCYFIV